MQVVNYNHMMPTRYALELEGLKGVVSNETFKEVRWNILYDTSNVSYIFPISRAHREKMVSMPASFVSYDC